MRLLQLDDKGECSLVAFVGNKIPPYAILSHSWEADSNEVTFQDLMNGRGKDKPGYRKIRFCAEQAARDGLRFSWIDTCCIDKSSSAELQEAINSMFRWYQNAQRCYVYLSDVLRNSSDGDDLGLLRWKPAFRNSRWFTRGWTLQELIAPASVEFFSREEIYLGNKTSMEKTVQEITGIAIDALRGKPLSQFKTDERFMWAEKRETTREEDQAYCLLGIFDVQMPLLYGEGLKKAMRRLQKEIKESLVEESLLSEEQKQTLLDSLKFEQIGVRQMNIKNAHGKTCTWLLRKSEYLDWLDSTKRGEHHGFLWIKGKPGTGKSTLMKFALANARKTMHDKILISFFFNARGEDLEKSTTGTYRSLLLQLLKRLPFLRTVFDTLESPVPITGTDHQWSNETLKMLLEDAILSLGGYSVVCFIDALDECAEEQIRDMVSFFEHIDELAVSTGIHFQVCFSSRHYPHITIKNGLDLVLEGQEGHTQDITNYLESELKIGQSRIAQQVRSELQGKASGIFMWVVLVTGILNKEHDGGRIHALRRRIQEIPSDLHELFRNILTRDSQNRDELRLCIQWVLFAKQPLSPEQLYFAILSGVEPETVSIWDPGDIDRDVIEKFILNSSKGLTEITSTPQKVQFIHESVRDFLLKENGLSNIWPDLENCLEGQSHEHLKQCCINYLGVDIFATLKILKSPPRASTPQAANICKAVDTCLPFIEYATNNALYHANEAQAGGVPQKHFLESFPLPQWVQFDNLLQEHEVHRHSVDVSLLYLLGERNMPDLIKAYPYPTSCLEVEKEHYGCPVFAAMATGSKDAVKALLENLAAQPIENQHYEDNTIYKYYEECNQTEIGRDFTFSKGRTILSYSAEYGYKSIVSLILKGENMDIDSKDEMGQTPLSWAARKGHEAVVALLLDAGKVDVDSKDQNGQTPLWWAVRYRHKAVVALLLNTTKVDANLKDQYGQTPLSWAVQYRNEAVAKLLLDTGKVDVNSTDRNGQTPLSWAAWNGHEAVAKLLLDTGKVDVDSKDHEGQTPLLRAAQSGNVVVVEMLLATDKVDVNSTDQNGKAPLSWAAQQGHGTVVRLLLYIGKVNIDLKDRKGQTPLSWAAWNGHEAVAKLLLDTGKVDVNSTDQNGQTPLLWAAQKGHKKIVQLLLNTGKVNVNSTDQYGQTPLSRAAWGGYKAVVEMLLATGKVDVNSKDQDGQTPLSWAAQ